MKVYRLSNDESLGRRVHPWTIADNNPSYQYYDFKDNPELIRTVLEDFISWNKWPAIETFYQVIEWINSNDSVLESNDCAFNGPGQNTDNGFPKLLQCSGRMMILYRNLLMNTSKSRIKRLEAAAHFYFDKIDPGFEWGVLGTAILDVQYISLPVPEYKQNGAQLGVMFWAWGDTDNECMTNCSRVFRNLHEGLKGISMELKESGKS
jgi:hypothetical protein